MKLGILPAACGLLASAAILTASNGVAQPSPHGRWLAEDINGGGVIDRLQTTLDLSTEGRATGFGGCNNFTGAVKLDGESVAFGALGSTRKACPPAIMDQERKFHQALQAAKSWRIDKHSKLVFTDDAGTVVARLTRL